MGKKSNEKRHRGRHARVLEQSGIGTQTAKTLPRSTRRQAWKALIFGPSPSEGSRTSLRLRRRYIAAALFNSLPVKDRKPVNWMKEAFG